MKHKDDIRKSCDPEASDDPSPGPTMRIFGSSLILLVIGVQITLLFAPVEDFPLTCMPMFAGYAGDEVGRYRFRFVGTPETEGDVVDVSSAELGFDESRFMRFFFYRVYHPSLSDTPWSHYGDQGEFVDRLSIFFAHVEDRWSEQHPDVPLRGIALQLEQRWPESETRDIGSYSVTTGEFIPNERASR